MGATEKRQGLGFAIEIRGIRRPPGLRAGGADQPHVEKVGAVAQPPHRRARTVPASPARPIFNRHHVKFDLKSLDKMNRLSRRGARNGRKLSEDGLPKATN